MSSNNPLRARASLRLDDNRSQDFAFRNDYLMPMVRRHEQNIALLDVVERPSIKLLALHFAGLDGLFSSYSASDLDLSFAT